MEKFKCGMCGKCCRNLKGSDAKQDRDYEECKKGTMIYIIQKPEEMSLTLFEWEVERLSKIAKNNNITFRTIPEMVILSSTGVPIILNWGMDHDVCPFLKDNKCTIYSERPLVCKSFPIRESVISILGGEKCTHFTSSEHCPRAIEIQKYDLNTLEKYRNKLFEIYEDVFVGSAKFDISKLFQENCIKLLIERGLISDMRISDENVIRKTQKSSITLFNFMMSKNIFTKNDIDKNLLLIEKKANEFLKGNIQ